MAARKRLQYQRKAEPVFVPDVTTPAPPLSWLTSPSPAPVRRVVTTALLAASVAFIVAGEASASVPTDWRPTCPNPVARVSAHPSRQSFTVDPTTPADAPPPPTLDGWAPIYPGMASTWSRKRLQYQRKAEPVTVPAAAPSVPDDWRPRFPDQVARRRVQTARSFAVGPMGLDLVMVSWSYPDTVYPKPGLHASRHPSSQNRPLFVPDVTNPVPALSWAPRYPGQILRRKSTHPAYQSFAVDPTTPAQAPATPTDWRPVYPGPQTRPWRAAAYRSFTVDPTTPAAAPVSPLDWLPGYPGQVFRKSGHAAYRPFVVDPTTPAAAPPVSLDWLPTYPGPTRRAWPGALYRPFTTDPTTPTVAAPSPLDWLPRYPVPIRRPWPGAVYRAFVVDPTTPYAPAGMEWAPTYPSQVVRLRRVTLPYVVVPVAPPVPTDWRPIYPSLVHRVRRAVLQGGAVSGTGLFELPPEGPPVSYMVGVGMVRAILLDVDVTRSLLLSVGGSRAELDDVEMS